MFVKKMLLASAILAVASGSAMASGVRPGQYNLGNIQQICLSADGTWYGTTYHFNGHWVNNPGGDDKAAIRGNYQLNGAYYGYFNDTITVERAVADWYDYNDDNTYAAFLPAVTFTFVKKVCDAPAAMVNSHPATK